MRPVFMAFLLCVAIISCKKSSNTPSDTKTATGTMRYYQTNQDKDKMRFETDGPETFLIYSADSYDYTFYMAYEKSLDRHGTLTYVETGETGCTLGLQNPPCTYPLPVVKAIKLVLDQ